MESIDAILKERGNRYGNYQDFSETSQTLKEFVRTLSGWDRLKSYQKESIDMILHKMARIINGDPDYVDSWRDMEGYAKLVVDILERRQNRPN